MAWKLLVGAALFTGVAVTGLGWLTGSPADADVRGQPLRGTLVSTAEMQVGRAAHTATELPDGRVLVASGGAEVYEPGMERFAPLPPMVTTRHSHTARPATRAFAAEAQVG